MTRKAKKQGSSGYTILLVDDSPEYLEAARLLLEHEGHAVFCATNGPEALALLREQPVHLLLLDYYMPGMTGEEMVVQLRQFNSSVQVILQTGYASEQPPRELLARLDIQGYYDKSEGPEKLLLWTDVGLKAAYTVQMLNKSRQGLRYILDATPDLHKIQPLNDLLQGILYQVAGLLGAVNSFLGVLPDQGGTQSLPVEAEGFLAMIEDDAGLAMRAGTGRFDGKQNLDHLLDATQISLLYETLRQGEIRIIDTMTAVPLRIGEVTIGLIYLDRPAIRERDVELLHIFANQAAVAIQNAQLYEMATLDPLTGAYVRGFFDKWLIREIRTAFRSKQAISFMLLDMDDLKQINDTAGHLAGDQALMTLTKVLRTATRTGDIVGRRGGDEFAIVLPQTSLPGAQRVGGRILEFLRDKHVPGPSGQLSIRCSIGMAILEPHSLAPTDIPRPVPSIYFQAVSEMLIQKADQALYQAKKSGGNRLCHELAVEWQPFAKDEATPVLLLEDEVKD